MTIKAIVCTVAGVLGAYMGKLFGGWTMALGTLLIFMAIDYITGVIVAGVFKKSDKSENGGLESRAGFKGLLRKGMILAVIIIAHRLDLMLDSGYIKDITTIAFCVNELISIVENAGLMGVPMPEIVIKAIDILKDRRDDNI